MDAFIKPNSGHFPWNKGKFTGQKPPLKLKEIWSIRIRLQLNKAVRDMELFNLAIDSKLCGCDLGIEVDDALEIAEQMEL